VDRIGETDPDVLVVDHDRVHWDGRVDPSSCGFRFSAAPPVFALHEWPEAIEILHVPWNKVVRRDLIDRLGVRFPAGWYEDIPFTYRVLLAAGRISLLDRVALHYRQRRTGAATRTAGSGHFAIFPNWAQVFDTFDDSRPHAPELRALIFRRMIWHLLVVRGNDDRMPVELRGRFFAAMTAQYHRYLPPGGYPPPAGIDRVKYRLVADGRQRTFEALRLGFRLLRTVRATTGTVARPVAGAVRRTARTGRTAAARGYYRLQLRMPMDRSLAVYAAYWYRGYACNPAAIYERAEELAPGVRGVWVVRRDLAGTMPPEVDHVVAGTLRYYRSLARARWLINNVNWPNYVVKRAGSTHVMTHHGTPLKVMGLDQQDYPGGVLDRDFAGQLCRADRWDFSITANPFTTQMWERAYPCRYETLETGYPRNDRLATATADSVARARARLGFGAAERVVLYAPTHREHHPGYHPPFDSAQFLAALGAQGRLLVRSHYFHDRSQHPGTGYEAERVLDYSSAMFDYAVLDRPIVVYVPDWQAYRLLRGVYFDLLAEPPGAVAQTFADLLDVFRGGAADSEAAAKVRGDFRRRFCALEDGRAAERVIRRVMAGGSG